MHIHTEKRGKQSKNKLVKANIEGVANSGITKSIILVCLKIIFMFKNY